MKTRQEIKAIAKSMMGEQRGTSIVLLVLYFLVVIVGGFLQFIPGIGILLVYATAFFIDYPLLVNVEGAFVKIYRGEKTEAGEIFSNLSVNYLRKVGGMAWMYLWTFLWTLLLIIPGIIKGIAYSMTPFILADCPNVTATQALKISMRMTNGYKGELFVMYLSFIGWHLLNILTLGILGIFYVNPYFFTTCAGYYVELREQAIASGAVSQEELE